MSFPRIPLPQGWPRFVRSAILHMLALMRFASAPSGRGRDGCARCRFLEDQLRLAQEELRINKERMASIPPARRPQYSAAARFAILALKSLWGWSVAETAQRFQVCQATIWNWTRRVDELGSEAYVSAGPPVNRFPDWLRDAIRTVRRLCPDMGKGMIAATLVRCCLHIGATTVGRILKERPRSPERTDAVPEGSVDQAVLAPTTEVAPKPKRIVSKYPNHIWLVDLTVAPRIGGMALPWPPRFLMWWPWCWWTVVVIDHFSRRPLATVSLGRIPTAEEVVKVLNDVRRRERASPEHMVCDRGVQFASAFFKAWAKASNVKLRYGAVGKHGSIAIIERFIRTMKYNWLLLAGVFQSLPEVQAKLERSRKWHNAHRPHSSLDGATPNEIAFHRVPANRKPRYEPRERWPRGSPCALPLVPMKKRHARDRFALVVFYLDGDRALPVVRLRRVA